MKTRSAAAVAATLFAGSVAHADVVYSNFGPADSYDPIIGHTIKGTPELSNAAAFTPDQAFMLDSVELALSFAGALGTTGDVEVVLFADAAGLPGAVIESLGTVDVLEGSAIYTVDPVADVELEAGTTYFLGARNASATTEAVWAWNLTGDMGNYVKAYIIPWQFVDSQPAAAYRVNGSVVPAPGAVALLGLAGVIGRRRRRR
jgi:MYXO-CTERM domain-containing protein